MLVHADYGAQIVRFLLSFLFMIMVLFTIFPMFVRVPRIHLHSLYMCFFQ